jgi:hypothetical protein
MTEFTTRKIQRQPRETLRNGPNPGVRPVQIANGWILADRCNNAQLSGLQCYVDYPAAPKTSSVCAS